MLRYVVPLALLLLAWLLLRDGVLTSTAPGPDHPRGEPTLGARLEDAGDLVLHGSAGPPPPPRREPARGPGAD
jgi:hypothetical protein